MPPPSDRAALAILTPYAFRFLIIAILVLQAIQCFWLYQLAHKSRLIHGDEELLEALQRMDADLIEVRMALERIETGGEAQDQPAGDGGP